MIKVSESLNGAIENFLELTPQINEHMEKNNNPHAVTKTQIGLANVVNEKQATAQQYIGHIQGKDKHRAEDIMYDDVSLKEKIESISEQNSGDTEQELAEIKEDVAQIKNELEKGSIILTGSAVTDTLDTWVMLSFEGDERFINSEGFLIMPENSVANIEITLSAIRKDETGVILAKNYTFKGGASHFDGSPVFQLEAIEDKNIVEALGKNYYIEANFVWQFGGYNVWVTGDDTPTYWKATAEIKNFMQISN